MKTAWKITGALLLAALLYMLVCLTVPPLFHRPTGETEALPPRETAAAQERVLCIDQNADALLWRLRLIEAARDRTDHL